MSGIASKFNFGILILLVSLTLIEYEHYFLQWQWIISLIFKMEFTSNTYNVANSKQKIQGIQIHHS